MKRSEFRSSSHCYSLVINVVTTHRSLQNSTKKRKVDDESMDYIPDSGISCESTQMSTNTEYHQPKVSIEVTHSSTTLLWSTLLYG